MENSILNERFISALAEEQLKRHRHATHASDQVATGHGQQVVLEELRPGDVGAREDARGDDEHVGHRVLQAQRHEGRDGQPDGHRLARRVLGHVGQVDRHADQPIAQQAPHEGHVEGQRRLELRQVHRGAARGHRLGQDGQLGDGHGAQKVAEPGEEQGLRQLLRPFSPKKTIETHRKVAETNKIWVESGSGASLEALRCKWAMATMAALPVKSSEPLKTVIKSPRTRCSLLFPPLLTSFQA